MRVSRHAKTPNKVHCFQIKLVFNLTWLKIIKKKFPHLFLGIRVVREDYATCESIAIQNRIFTHVLFSLT